MREQQFVAGPAVPGVYPHPCGTCGAPARRLCASQRRVVGGLVAMTECDGSDG